MEHWCKYFTLAPKLHLPLSPSPIPPPSPDCYTWLGLTSFVYSKTPASSLPPLLRSHSPSFLCTFSPRRPLTHSRFFFRTVFLWLFFFFCGDACHFFFSPPRLSHTRAQDMNGLFCVWMGTGGMGGGKRGGREGLRGFLMLNIWDSLMVWSLFQCKVVVLLPRFIRSDTVRVVRFRQEGRAAVGFTY